MAYQPYDDYLDGMDLDIRVRLSARMIDQKTTRTDWISSHAECVLALTENNHGLEFTVRDLFQHHHFIDVAVNEYNKPSPENPNAEKEYNKLAGQPLNFYHYAGLVERRMVGNTWNFTVTNRNMLKTISGDLRESRCFLAVYIEKLFRASGLDRQLNNFIADQNDDTFDAFRDAFYNLLRNNTPIGDRGAGGNRPGWKEVMRIFDPAMNVVANRYHIRGEKDGKISDFPITTADLRYNRENFRDVGRNRELTRAEQELNEERLENDQFGVDKENSAKTAIENLYGGVSQYQDEFADDPGRNGQRHHILSKRLKRQFRGYTENIITLTGTQHDSFAHGGNTHKIKPIYQAKLLICQSFYIERAIQDGITIYRKERFVELINIRYNLNLSPQTSFADLRIQIVIAVDNELHNAGRPEAEFLTDNTITEIEKISNTPFRNA